MSIYDDKELAKIEAERMEKIYRYPNSISKKLIGKISGKTILDMGCGPNSQLGKWVIHNGGQYIALDKNYQYLDKQKARLKQATIIQGDVTDIINVTEILYKFIPEIAHVRFLLVHLGDPENLKAKLNLVYLLKYIMKKTVIMEHDWSTIKGSNVIEKFRNLSIEICAQAGMDLEIGAKVFKFVSESVSKYSDIRITQKVFRRLAGHYYHELLPLARLLIGLINNNPSLSHYLERILDLKDKLLEESKIKQSKFHPPDIYSVVNERFPMKYPS